ncbi:hypothetical protein DYB32_004071 [Aphanomyces invadans]|uniref:EF-hand domain-containing protein n=1 Tax=Aphanomyces invadans TaxID=157072 RepID=A0A418AYK4_9STRA|nr:hypothetical protein DYB32_004071 [Aphanomyces invadans]
MWRSSLRFARKQSLFAAAAAGAAFSSMNGTSFCDGKVVEAATKPTSLQTEQPTEAEKIVGRYENRLRRFSSPERVFHYFASIRLDKQPYMTRQDFIRALTPYTFRKGDQLHSKNAEFNPMVALSAPKKADVEAYKALVQEIMRLGEHEEWKKSPDAKKELETLMTKLTHDYTMDLQTHLLVLRELNVTCREFETFVETHGGPKAHREAFFDLVDTDGDGLISYPEYMFFMTLLSNHVLSLESAHDDGVFVQIMDLMRLRTPAGRQDRRLKDNSTPAFKNLFGEWERDPLTFEKFRAFRNNLKREVMHLHFDHYDVDGSKELSVREFGMFLVSHVKQVAMELVMEKNGLDKAMTMLIRRGWSLYAVTGSAAAAGLIATENPLSGWIRVWTTLLILLAMGYFMRRHILGRIVSFAATWAASKTVQFVKIDKVILKPLQFFHVEVMTRDGWRILITRVEFDVRLKTFLSSFGQMKLVWVVVDALSVTPPSDMHTNASRQKEHQDDLSVLTIRGIGKPVTAVMGVLKFAELQIKSVSCTVSAPLVVDGSAVQLVVQCTGKDLELAVHDISVSTGIMTTAFSHSSSTCLVQVVATNSRVPDHLFIDPSTSSSIHLNHVRLIVKAHYLTKLIHDVHLVGTGPAPSATAFFHVDEASDEASAKEAIVTTVHATIASIAVEMSPTVHEHIRVLQALMAFPSSPDHRPRQRRQLLLHMETHDFSVAVKGSSANDTCVAAFVHLVLDVHSPGNVSMSSEKATLNVATGGEGILPMPSFDVTASRSHITWSRLPRMHGQVELESLEWSMLTNNRRLDCTAVVSTDVISPRVLLTGCRVQLSDANDVRTVVVQINDTVAYWNHASNMENVVAMHSLAHTCQRLRKPSTTTAESPSPQSTKMPLDLSIASNSIALHVSGMAHLPDKTHVFTVQALTYHVVESDQGKVTTVHAGVGAVARTGNSDKLIQVSSVGMRMTRSAATGADAATLDVHDVSLDMPAHWKLMVFVKQVQQIFSTSIDQGKRRHPPLELSVHVTNFVMTLTLPDDRNNAKLKLAGHSVDVKSRITSSLELSHALEDTLKETDTCFSVADYRAHVAKTASFAIEAEAHQVELGVFSTVQSVWSLRLDTLSLVGDIHEVSLRASAVNIPRSRICVGVRAGIQRPTLHVDKVFVALEVIPITLSSLDDLINTSCLDKDYVRVNPRHRTFGSVEVAVFDSSWTASLTSENVLSGHLSEIRLAMDKTNRIDCHVADLSLDLSSAQLLQVSQVQWAVQFVHQGTVAGVDAWHAVVSGTITSRDKIPTVRENKLSLEWTTLVGVIKTFLTEQLLPPCVERHRPAQGFNALTEISASLALRPVQIGWSEANTPTLIHFEMNQVDVSFRATKTSTDMHWLPQSFAVDVKSLQGLILEGSDSRMPRPNSFVVQAASVHAVNASVQTNKHVPIQVDKLKLQWTVAIRDHIFHMVDIIHDDVVHLLEIVRGNGERPTSTTLLVHKRTSPTSLLDLLHQGKLGQSDESNTSSSQKKLDAGKQPFVNHFPTGLVLTKQFSITLVETQIHVAEPESKSSMVVASQRIQIELGKDHLVAYTMADIVLTDMSCHVAPLDVDIDAGVLWYNPQQRSVGAPSLLQPIMNECSITCKYNMALFNQATFIQIDMPSMVVGMDSNQFFQCFSVVRHVLLAPPKVPKPKPNVAPLTMDKSVKLKKLQAAVSEELRMAGLRSTPSVGSPSTALKCVAFRIGRAQCRFRTGPEDGGTEFVAIGMDEAEGSHVYFDDSCTKFGINMQWLEIQNLKPGSSSMCFDDPMSVVKPRLDDGAGQQISIFPGIPYDISIQLAVDFYELMFKFFFGTQAKTTAHEMKMHMTSPMAKFGMKELLTRPPSLPTDATPSSDDLLADEDDEIAESSGAELFFFNYVRIGNICLNISCLGFVVNLNGFELELPHFVCQGKLCTWKQLLRKFEGHLAWHVTKESASSGLNHVKKKFLTLNKTFKRKDKPATPTTKKDTTENMATLFGPYHQHD